MTSSTDKKNQGVIIEGGALYAKNLAVGKNAEISNIEQNNNNIEQAAQELLIEISQLIESLESSHVESERIEDIKRVKIELEKDSPDFFSVKSMLLSFFDGIKTTGSVASTTIAIKKLLDIIAPSI